MANPPNPLRTLLAAGLQVGAFLVGAFCFEEAHAYTPESPVVREMVQRAKQVLSAGHASQPGGAALVGMALLKIGEPLSHNRVQHAITECRNLANAVNQAGVGNTCYNEAIACMFFCELDSQKYRQEIEYLLQGLLARQRANGCWAYQPYSGYDDTSQSQYGMLALWAAHVHGFDVPPDSIERAMVWFMRVQDASGGWCYKSKDPGGAVRVRQTDPVTLPMSAAGLGSVYIGAYLMGFAQLASKASPLAGGLPPAVRKPGSEDSEKYIKPASVTFTAFQNTARIGDAWFQRNHTYDFPKWTHYYMYGLERYKSFQEKVTGKTEKEPAWYNAGVNFLKETQDGTGGWKSRQPGHAEKTIDTAFAVLFLVRSTKKLIAKSLEEGSTRGGKDLPPDLTNIQLVDGKVVDAVPQKLTIDELLEELEDAASDVDPNIPNQLVLSGDTQQRAAQLARLRRMVMTGAYQARLTAARTLGRDRDLENVPALIFALSDPDYRVSRAARNGLRFISRKFDGFGLPDKPKRHEWQEAQSEWKAWYLSVRPDGAIIE